MAEVAFAVSLGTMLTIETVKALTQLVTKRAREETTLVWGSKDQYKKLSRKFELVGALLDDLGRSNPVQRSALVDIWLTRVKNVFYMADNLMDEYAYENVRRKLEFSQNMSICFSVSFSDIFFHIRMSLKVREIIALFGETDKEAKDIGLNPMDFVRDEVSGRCNSQDIGADGWNQARKFASYSNGFVGRENDEKILLEMLCDPADNMGGADDLSIVAIVGMGGIGKTTLARRLYDHDKIGAHFANKKYWICVSENFDIARLLNEMLEAVTSEKQELSNTDTIIRKLQRDMKGNRILVVLDDVWNGNKELWDSLKGSLQRIQPLTRSVILITTRSHEVAENAGVASPHLLKELSSDESWALLKQNGFISRNSLNLLPLQEEVGRRILDKCNGVPLAIKVVGGLLKSRRHLHEWESLEKSELWNLPQGLNHILPSLMLSFNHLPSLSLKQCFAYLSIFPRNCYMYKSELIGAWSSQGYLCDYKTQNQTLAERGKDNLKVLVDSSLLQSNEVDGGKFMCYNIHDLVYDLAVYVSGNELIKNVKDLHEKGNCRHLVFSCRENKNKFDFPAGQVFGKLRTISFTGNSVPWNMLIQARYLRTLFLDETGITELPPAIGLLKHLRYLDLSWNPIKTLPDSIGKLYQLQTIILLGCKYMTKLPKVLYSLVNLRYIWTKTPMFACKGLGQLTNLQALPCLALEADDEGWTIDELGKLHELKDEIDIHGLECVTGKEEARKAGFADKVRVSRLSLAWTEGREESSEGISDEDVLDGLEPHPNITSLKVQNFNAEKFPTWITNMAVLSKERKDSWTRLNNLTEVKLRNCSRCQTLPTLGQLPLLKCLILSGLDVKCIGSMFYDYEDVHRRELVSFPSLREFEISKFEVLTEWIEPSQEAFPCLEIFRVRDCYFLESVPVIGINSLRSLELQNLHCVNSLDIIKYSTGLTSLLMKVLPKITSLPQELANYRKLEKLCLNDFPELLSLPGKLESLVSLQSLQLTNCPALNSLPDDFLHGLSSLREFFLYDCPSLSNIPTSLEGCTSLVAITILKCPMIKDPPTNFSELLRLSELLISYHPANHLKSVLAVQHLPQLRHLGIGGFRDDEEMTDYFSDITPLNSLASVTTLVLSGRPEIKTLPRQLGSLTRIVALFIWKFDELERIPDWICNISSLEVLFLEFCKNLKCLPSKGVLQRLPRLSYLRITDCPLLSERYAKDYGPEWHNISHVEWIEIDHKEVQGLHE